MWPYKPERFPDKPLQSCFTEALRHQLTSYHRIERNLNQLKSCLAEGYPFVFGFIAYQSFEGEEVAKSGKLNMPKKVEAPIGGHAAMAVGYIESSKRFIVRNSWGSAWGQNGYFTIPYDYLLNENLSDDFWTIRIAEPSKEKKKVNGNNGNSHLNGNGHEVKNGLVYATSNGHGVLTQTFGYRLKMTL
jgi:C1A family cysteine protease